MTISYGSTSVMGQVRNRTRRVVVRDNHEYPVFLQGIQATFEAHLKHNDNLVFTTDVSGLWENFIFYLPEEERQHHTCRTCQKFVERYGGLVTITEDGRTKPLMWSDWVPDAYRLAVSKVRGMVEVARVTGVFYSEQGVWGLPSNVADNGAVWTHMCVTVPDIKLVHIDRDRSAEQKMAVKKEDARMLREAMPEYSESVVNHTVSLLKGGNLHRASLVLPQAEWLQKLYTTLRGKRGHIKECLTWRAVATASNGFCHIKGNMIGSLMNDIRDGLPFQEIQASFRAKMSGDKYLRPTAAPKAGTIDKAEKIMEALQSSGSLERRWAFHRDIQEWYWVPTLNRTQEPATGLFGHLRQPVKQSQPMTLPEKTVSWLRFQEAYLSDMASLEMRIDNRVQPFGSFTAAQRPEAPPILRWDREERRNTVSHYVYTGGSTPHQWSMNTGWAKVYGVVPVAKVWHTGENAGQVAFLLEGAQDIRNVGNGLFPETLRGEYHEIRSVIEAYSKQARYFGTRVGMAAGLFISLNNMPQVRLRGMTKSGDVAVFLLDRWE